MTEPHSSIKKKTAYWGILATLAFPFIAVYYGCRMLFSTKYRQGLRQRLTLYSQDELTHLQSGPYIWLHTVSLGELNAARPLIVQLKQQFPQYQILVSTVTETGQAHTQNIDAIDYAIYLPIDLFPLCQKSIRLVNPQIILIFETELWPNFLRAAFHHQIPTYLINARLSDQSFGNYKRVRHLFLPLLNQFHAILAQSELDSQRFFELGVKQTIVTNAGNIKFDSAPEPDLGQQQTLWRELFHINKEELVLVAGSTFPGEERILAEIWRRLREQESINLRLIIAPRHTPRTEQIIQELKTHQFNVLQRSKITPDTHITNDQIILLDTTGELSQVYAAADLVFIGKSLTEKGGQNPIEPAAWGKAILFGRHMQNFRDVTTLLLRNQAAIQVQSESELRNQIRELCIDKLLRLKLGQNARSVVTNNQGTLIRIVETITPTLENKQHES